LDNTLAITWRILSEYISSRDHDTAAHHLVAELIDAGVEEEELWDMCKGNPGLRRVVKEELGEVEEVDLDDEYDE